MDVVVFLFGTHGVRRSCANLGSCLRLFEYICRGTYRCCSIVRPLHEEMLTISLPVPRRHRRIQHAAAPGDAVLLVPSHPGVPYIHYICWGANVSQVIDQRYGITVRLLIASRPGSAFGYQLKPSNAGGPVSPFHSTQRYSLTQHPKAQSSLSVFFSCRAPSIPFISSDKTPPPRVAFHPSYTKRLPH